MDGRPVRVEVDVVNGLPGLQLVGLPDASVRESQARVRAGVVSSGYPWPQRKIVVNLSPGDVVKEGPGFDLPIALGILMVEGVLPPDALHGAVAVGELGLDGRLRSVRGVLSVAMAAAESGASRLICPLPNAPEAALVAGLTVHPVASLAGLSEELVAGTGPRHHVPPPVHHPRPRIEDLADVRGQYAGRRALEVAAAGGHHLVLVGPPGAGKSMLSRRLPGILPSLGEADVLDLTRIHSVAGLLDETGLVTQRPFRAPHHSISVEGLIGGGSRYLRPGGVSLAHHGVLFLDELSAFSRRALEALREPLDDGRIRISRQRRTCSYPARFLLVAATNPCPCGFRDDAAVGCRCGDTERALYDRRLSGPLLDRFDLMARLERPDPDLLLSDSVGEGSAEVGERVARARLDQTDRLRPLGRSTFGDVPPSQLRRLFGATPSARATLARAARAIPLSGRGIDKVRRVALTIACLDGSGAVSDDHVHEAISLRGGPLLGAA